MGWLSRNKKPQGSSPTDDSGAAVGSPPPVPPVPSSPPVAAESSGPMTATGPATTPATDPAPAPTPAQTPPEPTTSPEPQSPRLTQSQTETPTPRGQYGPRVHITGFDAAPAELTWQVPINGELYRVIPGPDRPDYSIMLLERPLHVYPGPHLDLGRVEHDLVTQDRRGRTMVRAHALVVCARFTGQQLHPGMVDFPVNVAAVIANSVLSDPSLDFDKISYTAVGFLSEGHAEVTKESSEPETLEPEAPGPESPAAEGQGSSPGEVESSEPEAPAPESSAAAAQGSDPAAPEPLEPEAPVEASPQTPTLSPSLSPSQTPTKALLEEVLTEVALTLRQGIRDERDTDITDLHARLAVDAQHRIVGLSGNADGGPPAPTRETFDRINTSLARLSALPPGHEVTGVTVTVKGDEVTYDVEYGVG